MNKDRHSLIGLEIDDPTLVHFMDIARLHCKHALEHSKKYTLMERRREIVREIQSLRSIHEALIAECRKSIIYKRNNRSESKHELVDGMSFFVRLILKYHHAKRGRTGQLHWYP